MKMLKVNRSRFLLGSVVALFVLVGLIFLTRHFSKQYIKAGDQYLVNADFRNAIRDYQTAQILWPFPFGKENLQPRLKYANEQKDRPQILIFLKEVATQSQVDELVKKIEQFDGVTQVKYISKDEALKLYLQTVKNEPVLQQLVNRDILPASIEVRLDKIDNRELIENLAKNDPIVDTEIGISKIDINSIKLLNDFYK